MAGGGYDTIYGFNSGNRNILNQSSIDKQIQDALNRQNGTITNDIVRQSANVGFRDPSSYFWGFTGNPYMQKGQQSMPPNVASPQAMPASNQYQNALQSLMQQYNLLG